MTRAIKEIVIIAFANCYATPYETNFTSRRILEKTGFALETRFEKVMFTND